MAEQEILHTGQFDPTQHGIWARFVDSDGGINRGAWLRARAEGAFVGTCVHCGSFLVPEAPEVISGIREDYAATCQRALTGSVVNGQYRPEGCGATMLAPNGRIRKHHRKA